MVALAQARASAFGWSPAHVGEAGSTRRAMPTQGDDMHNRSGAADDMRHQIPSPDAAEGEADETELTAEEADLIGNLGNEFDDPEGWLAESERYWVALAASRAPTRAAWLRHRAIEAWRALRSLFRAEADERDESRIPDSVWTALFEAEVGPLSSGSDSAAPTTESTGQVEGQSPKDQESAGRPRPAASASSHVRFALDSRPRGWIDQESAERVSAVGSATRAPGESRLGALASTAY